ncbi:nucleotide-sensitive chloride conductance regulator (ICln) family protein [Carex rostrata]
MVLGIQPFSDRTDDGGPRLNAGAEEEVMRVERGAAIALGRRQPESPGTLYVTTKRVIWLSDTEKEKGYSVDFVSISLHAVSRDPEAYPQPCIYTQIDIEEEGEESDGSGSDSGEDTEISKITEMRFLPSDASQLDSLFEVFCHCAELNPDPNAEIGEEEEEENSWVYSDEMLDGMNWQTLANPIGHSNGDHDLASNILELHITDERFEDAEEMEEHRTHGSNGY